MKKLYFLLLILISTTAFSQEVKREFTVKSGQTFNLDSEIGGSIIVKGSGQNKVRVAINHNGSNDFKFDFQETGQGVTLKATGPNKWNRNKQVKFEVTVPENFNLMLKTSGGNIAVTNVDGNMNGKTSGGNLSFTSTNGKINMKTSGGNISLSEVEGEGLANTSGGNIGVNNSNGKFDLKTSGGNITLGTSQIEGSIITSGGNIICKNSSVNGDVKTSGGNIVVDKAPQGISVATSGGNININSATDHAVAKTSGGNINLKQIDGWITAKTSGGNVTAQMIGDPNSGKRDVEITSSGGTLTLTVPSGLDMNVQIETNYNSRYNGKKPEIKSDFNITTSEEQQGNNVRIYGTGKIGSGKHTIKLKTSGGSVYLKKG